MREREIKNTKIYTSSPFLNGYVQSFANKKWFSLKRSPRSIQYNIITLAPSKTPLHPATHNPLHSTVAVKQCRTLLHAPKLQTLCNMETKHTITNHKPHATCHQITRYTIAMKKQQCFYTKTDYRINANQCRRLSSGAEPRLHENHSK